MQTVESTICGIAIALGIVLGIGNGLLVYFHDKHKYGKAPPLVVPMIIAVLSFYLVLFVAFSLIILTRFLTAVGVI